MCRSPQGGFAFEGTGGTRGTDHTFVPSGTMIFLAYHDLYREYISDIQIKSSIRGHMYLFKRGNKGDIIHCDRLLLLCLLI